MSEALDVGRSPAKKKRSKKDAAKVSKLKSSKPAKTSRKATAQDADDLSLRWRGFGLGVLLLAICIALGVQVSNQSQRMRSLYSELQQEQIAQDALLAQRSRLLIERGTLKSYNGAEKLAVETLDMRFPESITRIEDQAPRVESRRERR